MYTLLRSKDGYPEDVSKISGEKTEELPDLIGSNAYDELIESEGVGGVTDHGKAVVMVERN